LTIDVGYVIIGYNGIEIKMTDEEKKRLNEKLARWVFAGWTVHVVGNEIFTGQFGYGISLFTDSLDTCVEWLVPMCHMKLGQVTLESHCVRDEEWDYSASIGCGRSEVVKAKTFALALCLVISKMIGED